MLLQMMASGRWSLTHCGMIHLDVTREAQEIEEEQVVVEKRAHSARTVRC
jgi:hypothetical protein